jgi:hypothetical protein
MVEKLYNNDKKTAVVINARYGAGWSSWANENDKEGLLFDKNIAQYVIDNNTEKLLEYVNETYPDTYCGGIDDLIVVWIPIGSQFYISEYDGKETIEYVSKERYFVA